MQQTSHFHALLGACTECVFGLVGPCLSIIEGFRSGCDSLGLLLISGQVSQLIT